MNNNTITIQSIPLEGWLKLPVEIVGEMGAFLPPGDLSHLTQVCRKWRDAILQNQRFSTTLQGLQWLRQAASILQANSSLNTPLMFQK